MSCEKPVRKPSWNGDALNIFCNCPWMHVSSSHLYCSVLACFETDSFERGSLRGLRQLHMDGILGRFPKRFKMPRNIWNCLDTVLRTISKLATIPTACSDSQHPLFEILLRKSPRNSFGWKSGERNCSQDGTWSLCIIFHCFITFDWRMRFLASKMYRNNIPRLECLRSKSTLGSGIFFSASPSPGPY